jgi:hypothetical protein
MLSLVRHRARVAASAAPVLTTARRFALPAAVLAFALCVSAAAFAADPPPAPPPPPPPPPRVDTLGFQFIRNVTFSSAGCDSCGLLLCPGHSVTMTVSGTIPNCFQFHGLRELPTGSVFPVFVAEFADLGCFARCLPGTQEFAGSIDLGAGFAGVHSLLLMERQHDCLDTTLVDSTRSHSLTYVVENQCPPPPPSVDSLVRGFTSLRVLPAQPCAGDTVRLQLLTNGCPPCLDLTSLSQTRVRGILATMDWRPNCVEFACMPETLSMVLGQFAAGHFELVVDTDVHVLDTVKPDSVIQFLRRVTFDVAQSCDSTNLGCLAPSLPPLGLPLPDCAVRVAPGGSGDVLVPVLNRMRLPAIAGVEGWVTTMAPFQVRDIRYAGSASGVHVSWRQDGPLSRFVVFGATPDLVPLGVSNLLRVTVALDSLVPPIHPVSSLSGIITLASDPDGGAIPLCPLPAVAGLGLLLCVDSSATSCDVNRDGHADVRDLVLMTRCLRRDAPDSLGGALCHDCDHDGTFGIPDLFCCAREILGGPGVPGDSAHVRDGLVVTMDPPVQEGAGMRVRVRVSGAGSLGAALLRLRYPADRWRVEPSEMTTDFAAGWLPLVDANEAGLLKLGSLRLSDAAGDELVFELHAQPLDGIGGAGSLTVEGADLTSPDGAVYAPSAALPSAELSPAPLAASVELSPARPNPFGRSTSFVVSLPRDAAVELSVHDLAGRRVATLAQGRLAAGRRTFTWDGAQAHDGVYFVRLAVDGRVLSTRVALLREGR